jgi:proteasome lid subunit RPN8/RPN11
MNKLVLTPDQVRQIEEEGARAYPNECCGIMVGRDLSDGACTRRIVERLEPMANVWDEAEQKRRFAIDPLALMKAEKAASEQGHAVLGFYHSHPDHPARPSEYDRQHAWPFYSYVIVAITKRRPADMTSWVLDDQTKQFVAQVIEGGS